MGDFWDVWNNEASAAADKGRSRPRRHKASPPDRAAEEAKAAASPEATVLDASPAAGKPERPQHHPAAPQGPGDVEAGEQAEAAARVPVPVPAPAPGDGEAAVLAAALGISDLGASGATVSDVIQWFKSNNPAKSKSRSGKEERYRILDLFAARYGGLPVAHCKAALLLGFINAQTQVESPWSRRRWAVSINRPFNAAAQLGLIDKNPFKGLSWPQGSTWRDWTNEEFQRMLRASPAYFRRVLVFLRFSGCRPGEMRALRRKNIIEDKGHPHLRWDEHKTAHKVGKPRLVPLNSVLRKLLAYQIRWNEVRWNERDPAKLGTAAACELDHTAARGWSAGQVALLGTMPDAQLAERIGKRVKAVQRKRARLGIPTFSDGKIRKYRTGVIRKYRTSAHPPDPSRAFDSLDAPRLDEHVFRTSYGTTWSNQCLSKRMRELRERAGLPRDVHLHGLRHTFCTQAILRGVDILTLSHLLGHENISMTQRYSHLVGQVDHLAAAMEQVIGPPPPRAAKP